MKHYDVVIIGAGVSGIFAAIQLTAQNKRILIIDAGKPLTERLLLLGDNIATSRSVERYFGFGGLGISEGKYNYTNDFGGDLARKIGHKQSLLYQQKVDQLLCQYGGEQRLLYSTFDAELAERAKQNNFKILSTQIRHLGTSLSVDIFKAFATYLDSRIESYFNTIVEHIEITSQQMELSLSNQQTIYANNVIIAVGHSGMDWFEPVAQQLKLKYENTRLDLGFRIEMCSDQLDSLLKKNIETKLCYQTAHYNAITYCMNPKGRVIAKYQDGLVMPDGQNANEIGQSSNLNFSLFISKWFTTCKSARDYLRATINKINQQQDRIVAQKLADIDARFLPQQQINPTLKHVTFADLSNITPTDYLSYTCDFLSALERLLGKPIDGNTILYAMDSKSYAPVVKTNRQFLTHIPNLYIIGDCSGVTSSLSQAAASGLFIADQLV